MNSTLAVIGGGNMGRAIIGGLLARGGDAACIMVADPSPDARAYLRAELGITTVSSNHEAVVNAETIVLAVKPQQMREVARDIAPSVARRDPLVISIAAGIPTASLTAWLTGGAAVVRAMPNTPALIGRGITALYATAAVKPAGRDAAESLLRTVGSVVWVQDEGALDAVTALSGSGPAYFFLFIECLERAGVALGLDPSVARQLALETAAGATELARTSALDPAALRAQVTSKGGTTERALQIFAAGGFEALVDRALRAAAARAQELSREFGER
ncbi:MAG: pyrroline-5-carboxylate reductase [Gammaproteobacteria bacterium]|nr:pyrroline-5-carboxylate reductase [Gammaproteobacteria bacterium]